VLPYELIQSPSELRIRVNASSLEELFRRSLVAMFEIIEPDFAADATEVSHTISIKSADRDLLLIDFLSRALYLSDINDEAYFKVDFIRFTNNDLTAVISGNKITGFDVEIKAVTYHEVHIKEKDSIFSTEITFDI